MFIGGAVAVVVGLILGFVSGGLLYRQSRRWCPGCGAPTVELAHRERRASAQ